MDKTLQTLDKSLSTLIEGTTEKGTKLIEFLYEQAPEVINQLLMWKGAESFISFVFGIVLIIGFPILNIALAKKWYNWSIKKFEEDDHPGTWVPIIFGSIIGLPIALISGCNMLNLIWLKIYLAPKVFLLEYITNNI